MACFTIIIFLIILIAVALVILLASILSGQYFILSIERYMPNYESQKSNKAVSRLRRLFRTSSKRKQSEESSRTSKRLNFIFKYANKQYDPAHMPMILFPEGCDTEDTLEDQQKEQK
jgi:hypothetical protein